VLCGAAGQGEVEQELLSTLVNPAVFEMAGHIIMKRREDFESMTEEAADAPAGYGIPIRVCVREGEGCVPSGSRVMPESG